MNGEDSTLADAYVQEFVLDNFENPAPIKPELVAGDGSVTKDTAPGSPVLPDDKFPARLPDIPHPSPQLLTPPDNQCDYQHPRSVLKTGNLIMYSNVPGTPPDTPPVSNSPSPPQIYQEHHHLHHQSQYSQLQPLHHYQRGSDDMVWVSSQSVDLRPSRQEPLDLRPCNGETLQNWNMMQQHTLITGKRIIHADYFQSYGHRQVSGQPQSPLLTSSSSSGSISSSLSLTTSVKSIVPLNSGLVSPASSGGRSAGSSRTKGASKLYCANDDELEDCASRLGMAEVDIDDDLLVALTVRDLNARLKGTPKDRQLVVKQRRRTLKNRGYARNCRNKRVVQRDELEFTNHKLQNDLSHEKMRSLNLLNEVGRLQNELANEKRRGHNLQGKLRELQADLERLSHQLTESGGPTNPSNLAATPAAQDYL